MNGRCRHECAEHAFQHIKAVENKCYNKARAILNEPSPNEAMNLAKGIKTTAEWNERRQLLIMEEIIKLKKEQVPAFAEELQASSGYNLVEFSRSPFWGSGSTGNLSLDSRVFEGNYRGLNHLGKILMRVRDHY